MEVPQIILHGHDTTSGPPCLSEEGLIAQIRQFFVGLVRYQTLLLGSSETAKISSVATSGHVAWCFKLLKLCSRYSLQLVCSSGNSWRFVFLVA